jgi:hypothetical protein
MILKHNTGNSLLMQWLYIPEHITLANPQEIDINLYKMNIQLQGKIMFWHTVSKFLLTVTVWKENNRCEK